MTVLMARGRKGDFTRKILRFGVHICFLFELFQVFKLLLKSRRYGSMTLQWNLFPSRSYYLVVLVGHALWSVHSREKISMFLQSRQRFSSGSSIHTWNLSLYLFSIRRLQKFWYLMKLRWRWCMIHLCCYLPLLPFCLIRFCFACAWVITILLKVNLTN